MASWFGLGKKGSEPQTNTTVRALPATWYHSPAMYQLERRSIFSKKWILVTHRLRVQEAGEYIQITEAGFPFFVIKDRQENINAFHNVCRHRAYPLVEKECGKVSILACKYHGWSYGMNGRLAKAPKYQDLDSFNKEDNGLYPVHVHVDHLGFVWINLDASPTPSVSWEDDFAQVDQQPRFEAFDMTKYHFDHQWEMVGNYNWKTLADNYNECYHCPTGHPGLVGYTNLNKYWVETKGGHIQHFNTDKPGKKSMGIFSTFLYPNASFTISQHFFYIMRCIPISSTQTKMEYEVYRANDAAEGEFNWIDGIFKKVLEEDKDLCNATQKNLQGGIFSNGELHPHNEKGPLYFQAVTRELVMTHYKEEEAGKEEIWPATPAHTKTQNYEEEVEFCRKLECTAGAQGGELEW